jgi:hypothetical protein
MRSVTAPTTCWEIGYHERADIGDGFQTPERAGLAAAMGSLMRTQARADTAARRVRKAVRAVAKAEGGGDVDPVRRGDLLGG